MNNILKEKIIDVIFINIMSFLPIKNVYSNRFMCKKWYYILISKLTKKIIPYYVPTKIALIRKDFFGIFMANMTNIKNQITFSEYNNYDYIIYDHNKKKICNRNLPYFSSNSKFILGYDYRNVKILDLDFQELHEWKFTNSKDLTIDENHVYIIENTTCYVYDFKGKKINSWNILESDNIYFPKMRANKNKIYVSINDNSDNWIKIFSNEGKFIRNIHISKNIYNKFYAFPFDISRDIIYVLDYVNNCIKFFTCDGDLILKFATSNIWNREECEDISKFLVIGDNLYIYNQLHLFTFKLFFQ
jgi:hypothetical protein